MPNTTLPSWLVSRSVLDIAAVVAAASVAAGPVVAAGAVVAGVVAAAGCGAAAAEAVGAELDLFSLPQASATTDINANAPSVRPAVVPNLRVFTQSPPCVADRWSDHSRADEP